MVEVVKDVGLITCERGDFGQECQTPHMAKCQWDIAPMTTTWRERFSSGFGWKKKIGETHGKEQDEEQRVKEQTTLESCSVMCNN